MKPILVSVLSILLIHTVSQAQTSNLWRIGVTGHVGVNIHDANFRELPNIPCCSPGFSGGSGFGWDAGLLVRAPLAERWFVDLRGGIMSLDGTMSVDEERTVNLFGEATDATFRHNLESSILTLRIDVLGAYRLTKRFSLLLGPTFVLPVSATVDQREVLVLPETGTFENGQRERLTASADIPDVTSMLPVITLGASYDISLDDDERWNVSPEILLSYALTDVTSAVPWTIHPLRGGVAVSYALGNIPQEEGAVKGPERGDIDVDIDAVGVESDGRETPTVVVRVEEFLGTNVKPLLPLVFFDQGSSTIPERYPKSSSSNVAMFTERNLHELGMLDTYHRILDIVGSRMREFPQASITLTGCTSADNIEPASSTLGRDRAEAVRNYLTTVWNIAPTRIRVESRGLPALPSNVKEADGREENRRVEIEANDPRILDPVWTTDTLRTVSPPALRFSPTATADNDVASWSIVARQGGRELKRFDGNGDAPSYVLWNLEDDQAHSPRTEQPLTYELTARDTRGDSATSEAKSIAVDLRTIRKKRAERIEDKEIDRYALIGFDFGDDKIQGRNARLVERIRQKISIASTVDIVGSTDRIGDEDNNLQLSERRAKSVAKALDTKNVSVVAVGESAPVHTNDLPEGRFYNRTVTLVVKTPVVE